MEIKGWFDEGKPMELLHFYKLDIARFQNRLIISKS